MAYIPTNWVNNSVTPINADNLNKIEQGIKINGDAIDATNVVVAANTAANAANTAANAATNTIAVNTATQVSNLIVSAGDSNPEVVASRGSEVDLPTRLNNFDTSLSNIPSQVYITEKAKQIDLNTTNTNVANIVTQQHYTDYVPKDFNIIGDGITDDTANIQNAFNTMNDGDSIKMKGSYLIKGLITISKVIKVYGKPTFVVSPSFVYEGGNRLRLFVFAVDGIEFEKVGMTATGVPQASQDNAFVWATSGKNKFSKCSFIDLPFGGSNFNGGIAFLSGGIGGNIVDGCYFEKCPGGVFTQQPHDSIINNFALNPRDVSFVLNGPNNLGGSIKNNKVYADGSQVCAGHIAAEQGPSNFEIAGNYIHGIKNGYGLGIVDVGGYAVVGVNGLVHDNIVDGGNIVSVAGQACLKLDGYYDGIKIYNNIFKSIGSGQASNSPVQLAITDCDFYNNKIIQGGGSIGITVNCNGGNIDRTKTMRIYRNDINNNNMSWAIKIQDSFPLSTLKLKDNDISNSVEGINGVSCTGILELAMENNIFKSVTSSINMINLESSWLQTYFNSEGYKHKHLISKSDFDISVANGNAPPTSGTYIAGNKTHLVNPAPAGYEAYICTIGGTACNIAWVATTSYIIGNYVYANNKVYSCTVAGTSGSTAPSHSTGSATDGSVTWLYVGALAVFKGMGLIQA